MDLMRVVSLASGSKGNCYLVSHNRALVLLDVGISYSTLEIKLRDLGESVSQVNAIFLTHCHYDHIKGLEVLLKKMPHIEVWGSVECIASVKRKLLGKIRTEAVDFRIIEKSSFYYKDFLVSAFLVPHDAKGTLGFSFWLDGENKFTLITDAGCITEEMRTAAMSAKLLFIESNHCKTLIKETTKYPKVLKDRILSDKGHLSNCTCAAFLVEVLKKREDRVTFCLCHLSENTNTKSAAIDCIMFELESRQFVLGVHFMLEVLCQYDTSEVFEI